MVLGEEECVRVVEDAVGSVDDRAYADRVGCDEERDFVTRILDQRDAAIRERDTLRAERITQALTADRFAAAVMEADTLQARVAELEAAAKLAPHANADGEANHAAQAASEWRMLETGETLRDGDEFRHGEMWLATGDVGLPNSGDRAYRRRIPAQAASGGGEQPRGWLTEDEREIIAGIADDDEYTEEGQNIAKALLARSSPPEVVLPKLHTRCEVNEANNKSPCLWFRRPDVIKSLAAAGVAVKEVGRE